MDKDEVKLDRNNGKTILRRFLHIGPLLTIFIIKSITIMTLYLNSMWFPAHSSIYAFLNQATFITLSALTSFNFVMTAIIGPSYLPLGWRPKNKNDENQLQFCNLCKGFKAPRAHHCRKCERCVMKMDHHCPYVANCVGHGNQSHFIWFLTFAIAGCTHAAVILICSLYAGLYRDYYIYHQEYKKATVKLSTWSLILTIFNIGLSIGVVIAVGMLLFFQIRAVFRNRTGIEDWILDKAIYRRRAIVRAAREAGDMEFNVKPFVYPYDMGWKKNAAQVLNFTCLPVGNGIEWPVVEGCDQYTLTREQIAQKAEKRARTKQYRIAKKVTGSWFPLLSYGFKTACSPPLTDESRIALEIGDLVNVTRWRKHWLFGEKVKEEKNAIERSKGWFPRKSAVELYDENDDEDFDENEENSKNKKLK